MAKRVFLIVLDSFGVGAEPDAPLFGDVGTNTLGPLQGIPISGVITLPGSACSIWTA